MVEDTTETKITSIEDAVQSIIAPSEEPTEEVLEAQETEESIDLIEETAEAETEEVEAVCEQVEAALKTVKIGDITLPMNAKQADDLIAGL